MPQSSPLPSFPDSIRSVEKVTSSGRMAFNDVLDAFLEGSALIVGVDLVSIDPCEHLSKRTCIGRDVAVAVGDQTRQALHMPVLHDHELGSARRALELIGGLVALFFGRVRLSVAVLVEAVGEESS